ncbi:hypothetical protein N692_10945 [Lactiplantibacillus plantarum EGD-AQ4]|nr:hypothetical protein N692_10945 [Lactiplantibacillus plantarum EGD-AQ4]
MIVVPDWVVVMLVTWVLTTLWDKRDEIHNWFGI